METIQSVIQRTKGNSDQFAETLRHEQIPHLSFSQITTVEFCQYRYYLQYIKLVDPTPIPDYFTKGKLLHWIIASYYEKGAQNQAFLVDEYLQTIDRQYLGENQRHLHNALMVHLNHCWQGYQIIGVEEPFAISINPALSPCVGVIDLILEKDGCFIIVDHKTGRDFYPQDELQMAIYVKYIQQQYGDVPCEFYYDHYRWVNNLSRIRKPAFRRTKIIASSLPWQAAFKRIKAGSQQIERIRTKKAAIRNGECFRCPYHSICYE